MIAAFRQLWKGCDPIEAMHRLSPEAEVWIGLNPLELSDVWRKETSLLQLEINWNVPQRCLLQVTDRHGLLR